MKDISIQELKNTAVQMRMKVIDMIYKAQSGHPGAREPVEISMPGHLFMEGCPCSMEPSLRSVSSSDSGKKPTLARQAYWMGQT